MWMPRSNARKACLQTFPADEIVLFTHVAGDLNWLEEGVVDEVRDRFEIPVDHLIVESP